MGEGGQGDIPVGGGERAARDTFVVAARDLALGSDLQRHLHVGVGVQECAVEAPRLQGKERPFIDTRVKTMNRAAKCTLPQMSNLHKSGWQVFPCLRILLERRSLKAEHIKRIVLEGHTVELACNTKPMLPPGCCEKNRPPLTVSGFPVSYAFAAARLAKPRTADGGIGRPGLLARMPATMAFRRARATDVRLL